VVIRGAANYAAQGLRINAVAPGMTETSMTQSMLKLTAMREGASKQYPLGGAPTADELAAAMDWLLSPDAARLTGQVLAVAGSPTTMRPLVR
jgi:NAD(P)-dependent dehydrogenase (short-subunit alcohol dehydrogenase family)